MNSRQSLSVLLCLACLCDYALAQAGALALSAEQARDAGIAYARVSAATTPGDGMRLAGNAAFSIKGIEIVSAPAAGVVQEVLAAPMDRIEAGAPLARLYSPQLLEWEREYVQLSAQERLALEKRERDEALYREGIIALGRLQESRSAHAQARVAVRERAQLLKLAGVGSANLNALAQRMEISPLMTVGGRHAGTVLELLALPGQRVEAGAAIARLGRAGALALELQASRAQADRIRPGDEVRVAGCAKAGRVTALSPQMQAASQSVLVRAELPGAEGCLRPNQYVDATVRPNAGTATPAGAVTVPSAALVRQDERDAVWKRDAQGLQPVPVEILARGAESSVVRGELAAGDEVAVRGLAALKGRASGMGAPEAGR
ncbi:efflux RND transporter periplasmic adaptor subunit [Noviherbaspirillum pedocola]|uniref:Efflux RND transporter periplasmic adaptor subunit n=1 Tax=Noviherbaspirillum pedocola TaxID=2801341 RepID=A0A934SQS3_9BURK|nr:efflux RND transporter periplasmic adaptor subunit [Noviherbaspirillum pedocola]MBK4735031.1 efflux RND transporter periplasmic adaptor subunit [Noviherbaspirillum pedocola]